MSGPIEVVAQYQPTPEALAAAFWEMDSEAQADFFAALERLAGIQLCFQMAWVVREISERADHGDHTAQNGFQTMLAHAQGYHEASTERRHAEARYALDRLVSDSLKAMTA
jgi:hypothetical protein